MKYTQYLIDSINWSNYVDSDCADWAIASPTMKLLFKSAVASGLYSWDEEYYTFQELEEILNPPYGYGFFQVQKGSYLCPEVGTYPNRYWISTPNMSQYHNLYLQCNGVECDRGNVNNQQSASAIRPVVCLSSDVEIVWNEEAKLFEIN